MNQVTYHHYGTTILNAPIALLRRDLHTILSVPADLVHTVGCTTSVLEEVVDCASGSHTLIYRSTKGAPELAEYVASCMLACVADAPNTTFVEWEREYRPAESVNRDTVQPIVSALVEQDQAIASRLAADYGSTEVFFIDYTLGGA
jgi:hypothetical protein